MAGRGAWARGVPPPSAQRAYYPTRKTRNMRPRLSSFLGRAGRGGRRSRVGARGTGTGRVTCARATRCAVRARLRTGLALSGAAQQCSIGPRSGEPSAPPRARCMCVLRSESDQCARAPENGVLRARDVRACACAQVISDKRGARHRLGSVIRLPHAPILRAPPPPHLDSRRARAATPQCA